MSVTLSEPDPWKERIVKCENPLTTYLDTLLDNQGNVTSRYDHTHKIFNLVWNLSIESAEGARQSDVVKGMIDYCKGNRDLSKHTGDTSFPETWTNAGTVKTKTKQILKRLIDAGAITKSEDKDGDKNPDRVFYHPHMRSFLNCVEIASEHRGTAIGRLQHDNFTLDRALAMTRNFLHTKGLWGEFLQWHADAWGDPFPEFVSDSLGVRKAEPGEMEQRLAGLSAWEEERLVEILGATEGTVPTGDVRKRMEERLAWLQGSRQGTP